MARNHTRKHDPSMFIAYNMGDYRLVDMTFNGKRINILAVGTPGVSRIPFTPDIYSVRASKYAGVDTIISTSPVSKMYLVNYANFNITHATMAKTDLEFYDPARFYTLLKERILPDIGDGKLILVQGSMARTSVLLAAIYLLSDGVDLFEETMGVKAVATLKSTKGTDIYALPVVVRAINKIRSHDFTNVSDPTLKLCKKYSSNQKVKKGVRVKLKRRDAPRPKCINNSCVEDESNCIAGVEEIQFLTRFVRYMQMRGGMKPRRPRLPHMPSFTGVTYWKDLQVPGQDYKTNVLLCGEHHQTKVGHELMNYVYELVEAQDACVDLYIESEFDWTQTGAGTLSWTQTGAGTLSYIRNNYRDIPGLRVHHIDIRGWTNPMLMTPGRVKHRDDLRRTASHGYLPIQRWLTNSNYCEDLATLNRIYDFNYRELFTLMTCFHKVLRKGDRPMPKLKDKLKAADTIYKNNRKDVTNALCFHTNYDFLPILHSRIKKQRRRFLSTVRINRHVLDTRILEWFGAMVDYYKKIFDNDDNMTMRMVEAMTIDLFAFYRMFGVFSERPRVAGNGTKHVGSTKKGNGKKGCPLHQRNIVYVAGDAHTNNLQHLIKTVFRSNPDMAHGSLTDGTELSYSGAELF